MIQIDSHGKHTAEGLPGPSSVAVSGVVIISITVQAECSVCQMGETLWTFYSVHVPSIPSTWADLTATQFPLTTSPDRTISGPFHSVPFSGAEHDEGEVGSESAG